MLYAMPVNFTKAGRDESLFRLTLHITNHCSYEECQEFERHLLPADPDLLRGTGGHHVQTSRVIVPNLTVSVFLSRDIDLLSNHHMSSQFRCAKSYELRAGHQ